VGDVSLVFNLIGRDKGASATIARAAGQVRTANAASAASSIALGAALASAASWAVALGGAGITAAAGVGLIPGAAAAAAAAVTTLKLATGGLGDAWKATGAAVTSGGGGAANTAKQVAAAQREVKTATQSLADAQRAALKAQQDVTRARADEAARLKDLSREISGARLDEESATQAVADAEKELAQARRTGSADDVKRADLAYRQSEQTLEDVKARVEDLGVQQDKASKDGVEGSDAVQAALQRQEDAQRAVADATDRLADAQRNLADAGQSAGGGINKANAALAALSPNARALILTLRQLGSVWVENVRKPVQDAVFRHVAGDITALSTAYLPVLSSRLVRLGGSFNTAIREALGFARTRDTVADVATTLNNTNTAADVLGRAVVPIVSAFRNLAAVGSAELPQLAHFILGIATDFDRWIASARQSGQLQQWLSGAVTVLVQLYNIGVNVAKIVLDIFTAPGNAAAGGGLLQALQDGTAKLHEFLSSAQGQERISQILREVRDLAVAVTAVLPGLVQQGGAVSDTFSVTGTVMHFLAQHTDELAKLLPYLAAGFVVVKAAQAAGNIAAAVEVPLKLLNVIASSRLAKANFQLAAALRVQSAATQTSAAANAENAAALTAGDVAQKRGLVSMVASKAAMLASATAAKVAAAGQWLLNIALDANPIGLIILAVIALVAGIYLLWTHSETFRKIVTGAFQAVWTAIKFVWDWVSDNWPLILEVLTGPIGWAVRWILGHWDEIKLGAQILWQYIVDKWNALVGFFTSLPGRVAGAARGLWDGITSTFRGAVNYLISLWNRLDFGIQVAIPSWVPVIGGKSFSIPDIIPDLPYLAAGGTATRGGLAMVGERGPEVVSLPAGASVIPLNRAGGGGRIVLDLRGGDADLRKLLRRWIRTDNLLNEA
jgi:hypothetical protein